MVANTNTTEQTPVAGQNSGNTALRTLIIPAKLIRLGDIVLDLGPVDSIRLVRGEIQLFSGTDSLELPEDGIVPVFLPEEAPLTIKEALAEARKYVGPDESVMVQIQVWDAPHASNNSICIWDGSTHHEGKSLRQALDKLIAAHTDTSAQDFANESEALAAEVHQIIEAQH